MPLTMTILTKEDFTLEMWKAILQHEPTVVAVVTTDATEVEMNKEKLVEYIEAPLHYILAESKIAYVDQHGDIVY